MVPACLVQRPSAVIHRHVWLSGGGLLTGSVCVCVRMQVMDYGYPQFTEAQILQEFIKTDSYKMEVGGLGRHSRPQCCSC